MDCQFCGYPISPEDKHGVYKESPDGPHLECQVRIRVIKPEKAGRLSSEFGFIPISELPPYER